MFHSLHVSIDGTAEARVHGLEIPVEASGFDVWLLGHQHKDVTLGSLRNEIELAKHRALELLCSTIDDEIRVDVDK
jgi:hypothetical protein